MKNRTINYKWLDINKAEQVEWAATYLRKIGWFPPNTPHYRMLNSKDLVTVFREWLSNQEATADNVLLTRDMKSAWDGRVNRQKKVKDKRKFISGSVSDKHKKNFDQLRKREKLLLEDALEYLIDNIGIVEGLKAQIQELSRDKKEQEIALIESHTRNHELKTQIEQLEEKVQTLLEEDRLKNTKPRKPVMNNRRSNKKNRGRR